MNVDLSNLLSKLTSYHFGSTEADQLASYVKERLEAKDQDYVELSDDDVERIRLVGLLLTKIETTEASKNSGFQGEEWKRIGDVYGKLKILIEDLELNRIIDQVNWFLGGGCFFIIVDRRKFQQFLYAEIRSVLNRIKAVSTEVKEIPPSQRDEEAIMLGELQQFKSFVERDGFLAFWADSRVGSSLKNNAEEIARGEFMGFLAGRGIERPMTGFREVPEAAGRADVVTVEENNRKRVFELKVISLAQNRFEEGFTQLFEYLDRERLGLGYYLVFEARPPDRRTRFDAERTQNEKRGVVIVIDVYPIPPTRK